MLYDHKCINYIILHDHHYQYQKNRIKYHFNLLIVIIRRYYDFIFHPYLKFFHYFSILLILNHKNLMSHFHMTQILFHFHQIQKNYLQIINQIKLFYLQFFLFFILFILFQIQALFHFFNFLF